VAIQPDPYFALPTLRGAPAYARPVRPVRVVLRLLDEDDLPLAIHQTEEERLLAGALLARHELASLEAGPGSELAGAGDPGFRASGDGALDRAQELGLRRVTLREWTGRIRIRD
jgi:hypothetical protein